MENFLIAASAITPMFLVIALGYFLRIFGIIDAQFAAKANKIAFQVFLPCLLFNNIYTADIHTSVNLKLIIFTLVALVLVFVAVWLTVSLFCNDNLRRGVIIQAMYRSNFIILGLPIAVNIAGNSCAAVIGLLLAITLPCYNIFSIIALEAANDRYLREQNHTLNKKVDLKVVRRVAFHIITNPLIIATVLAFLLLLCGIKLPQIILQSVGSLADIAPALCLLILGSYLKFSGIKNQVKELTAVIIVKLLVIPAVVLGAAVLCGFSGIELTALMAIFATPTAVAGFTMVKIIGGDSELAANSVVLTSFLSVFTLFVFTYALISMGLI